MKALTVWQPWASLLILGIKKFETRGRRTNYRGEILIHAAKKPVKEGLALMHPKARKLVEDIFGDEICNLPTGAIIGKCELITCAEINQGFVNFIGPDEYYFGDYTEGRYAWAMVNPEILADPITVPGKQGMWNYDGEVGSMRDRHEKYKEIIILDHLLQEKGIPHELHPLLDGYQIEYPGPCKKRIYSVIEHDRSYGGDCDLLEIMGPGEEGPVKGFLSASDAALIIEDHYNAKGEKENARKRESDGK